MRPDPSLVCRGAPRDLGLDQGLFAAEAVRSAARAAGRAGLLGALRARLGRGEGEARRARDLRRFFPHLAERAAGLARGAGVSADAVVALLARDLGSDEEVALGVAPERSGDGAWLARAAPGEGIVRHSLPDNDYRSVEWVAPWGLPGLAGVNEHGLAVVSIPVGAPRRSLAPCAAPATLLAQDCLQRFDCVEKAVEWCTRRPAGGCAGLLLADARGDLAGVRIEGASRRVERPQDGLLLGPLPEARRAALGKTAAGRAPLDGTVLADVLGESSGSGATRLLLDAAGRRLGVLRAGQAAPRWIGPLGEERPAP